MIDFQNKIDNNFESNETTYEDNFKHTFESAKISILDTESNTKNNTDDNLVELDNNVNNINDETSGDVSKTDLTSLDNPSTGDSARGSEILEDNSEISNCLALTVKKDYSIAVVKNVVVRTFKGIWKVAISIFTLNIIKFFF